MRLFRALRIGIPALVLCLCGQAQDAPATPPESKGMPPRAAASDYLSQGQAGSVTIAAEFKGHSVPTVQGKVLSSEDYVVVEVAFFGPPGARLKLAAEDFALRINRKKEPLEAKPYGLVTGSLKDPEWEPPTAKAKSKTNIGGGGGQDSEPPPTPAKMPIGMQRAMAQQVQQASLPEGDRALPQAGLIFFQQRGKTEGYRLIQLIYQGPAGNTVIELQP